MKALGMPDAPLMAVFVRLAVRILVQGLLWGNAIGFGIALLQLQTGWITLDAGAVLSTVPIHLDLVRIAMVEAGILVACALAMFLPARYISRLDPVESLRFDWVASIFAPSTPIMIITTSSAPLATRR